jgi:alanine dehydrogenase
MDGTYITGIRTAASAVLSARMLSREDSRVATVIGAGVQGRQHLQLLPLIRRFERINVCSLRFEDAEKLAAESDLAHAAPDVERAVAESDVVCLAAHSPVPVIQAGWITAGTHVSSVGSYPPHGELSPALARTQRLFVDTRDAFQPAPVGCGELDGLDPAMGTTLGAVGLGHARGRVSDTEITVYKAMGIAMEDMVAANITYQRAKREGGGGVMSW